MAITTFSAVGDLVALDFYTGNNRSSKDVDLGAPDGPTLRVEIGSTIGNCSFETFVEDLRRNKELVGKENLLDAYHLIISQTHEEADPYDPAAGQRQHDMVREMIRRALPGHQAKLTTQRDNGRWEQRGDGLVWVPGKWHTHVIIANVSEVDAVLERVNSAGEVEQRFYAAGRAVDGYMNGIKHLRNVTDAVVWEMLGYDNAAYIQACRDVRDAVPGGVPVAHQGEKVTSEDLAQRAQRGHSSYDEVRVELREARALATSWDDYTARLDATGVRTRVTGKSGVSYGWVGDDGVEMKSRARKLGDDFTMAEVKAQCELNAQALANDEELVAPPRVVVPPPPRQKAKPYWPEGRAPWEIELEEYAAAIERDGDTYEGQARRALDEAMRDPEVFVVADVADVVPEIDPAVRLNLGASGDPKVVVLVDGEELVMDVSHLGPEHVDLQARLSEIAGEDLVPAPTQGTDVTDTDESEYNHEYRRPDFAAAGTSPEGRADGADERAVDRSGLDRLRAQDAARRATQLAAEHAKQLKQRERADYCGESADRGRGDFERSALQRGLDTGVRAGEPDPPSDPDDNR